MTGALLMTMFLTLSSFDLPKDWKRMGNCTKEYLMEAEKDAGIDVITIRSVEKINDDKIFGAVAKVIPPTRYLGKRVRMTGYVKTRDVTGWSGFWMRIDGQKAGEILGFDNMKDGKTDRAISGTNDWKQYELVLDVPYKAKDIFYGALLSGTGQIWFKNVTLEVVNSLIPTTGK